MTATSTLHNHHHCTAQRRSTSTICYTICKVLTPRRFLFVFMSSLGFVYIQFAIHIIKTTTNQDLYDNSNINGIQMRGEIQKPQQRRVRVDDPFDNDAFSNKRNYYEWKKYAVHLAGMAPTDIVDILKQDDPFGVRTFEAQLLKTESEKGRFLSLEELQYIFPCPTSGGGGGDNGNDNSAAERITLPDQRDHGKAEAFRNGTVPYFLFFQHLRKAGGTNFCSLAEHNLKKNELPIYYCMPDYHWNLQNRGAGYLARYDNKVIVQNMKEKGHKIAGNEWDPFDSDRFFDLPATFATSFRRPLDRALSQFRFECMEERGCKTKNVTKWWKKRRDLTNVYTWTFANEGVRRVSIGNSPQDAYRRKELIGKALDAVAKFNLVMVMEWLAYAPTHVTQVLGFKDTRSLTERVRPHINQHKREDGQEHNNMGAAGIAKASWTPEDYLPPALYDQMSHDLALDEILTDAARRMFLERIVCNDVSK